MPSARVRRFPKKRVGFVAAGRSSIRVITEIPPMIDGPCSWNAHVLPQDRAFCPISSVAGVYTPAFVERLDDGIACRIGYRVSPEFILRPSLSAEEAVGGKPAGRGACRRSLYSGLR